MPEEPRKRRTDRVSLAVPIRVSGVDEGGRKFDVEGRTVVLSRHGATIVLKQALSAEQEVRVHSPSTGKDAGFRVVGRIGGERGGGVYGVAQLDPNIDLWGIEFPPLADSKQVVGRLLMECSACRSREVVYLNELEVQVFQANQSLTRPCRNCSQSTLWTGAFLGASGQQISTSAADSATPEPILMPPPVTVGRRRNTRVNARLTACIRQAGSGDEVVTTENVSRGGLSFKSSKVYPLGSPIEVSVPYSPAGASIFAPARIAYVQEQPGEKLNRVGVAYVQVEEGLRSS